MPMRYEPSQRLFRLALTLAGTRTGLTLDEMALDLGVGRRTAERLRDTLAGLFPQLDGWDDDARVRRWRLPGGALAGVAEPRAEAVAAVEALGRECATRGEADRAGLLREAAMTLRALMRPAALLRAEPDIAALMEGEGIAMHPGPRPKLDSALLPTLRRAILGVQLVAVRYARDGDEAPVTRILCPYGTLYSGDGRAWLVGHVEDLPDMRLWRLDRIASMDLLDRSFTRRADFDLAAYAAQSFGVFQEEPVDVVLRVAPEAACSTSWTQPTLIGRPSRSRRNSTTPRYELRQISVSATIAWRSQALVTANSNSTSPSGTAGEKASSNTARALCVCW